MTARILTGIMLAFACAQDLRSRRVHAGMMTVLGIAAACISLTGSPTFHTLAHIAAGALPGLGLWLLSAVTNEAVGRGDALAVCLAGMSSGPEQILMILLAALFLTAFAGCILLAAGKAGKKSRLPFIPFLAAGYLLYIIFF